MASLQSLTSNDGPSRAALDKLKALGKPVPSAVDDDSDVGLWFELHGDQVPGPKAPGEEQLAWVRLLLVLANRPAGFASLSAHARALGEAVLAAAAAHNAEVESGTPLSGSPECWPWGQGVCEPMFGHVSPHQQLSLLSDLVVGLIAPNW